MNRSFIYLLFVASFFSCNYVLATDIPNSFNQAKVKLYKSVYDNQGQTFYTGCLWSNKKIDLASCGLENSFPTKHIKRAKRVEAEHVIPASWMYKVNGKYRVCYTEAKTKKVSPREYCQDHDENYRRAHNDLVNLRVSVGAINGFRSAKGFSETISGTKETTYRGNGLSFTVSSRVVIPDPLIRGDIARIAFYMQDTYGVTYSKRQNALFIKWDQEDHVSAQELMLNQRINQSQGLSNPFVAH